MIKKIGSIVIASITVLLLSIPSYALTISDIIYDKNAGSTDEFLVTITRPEGDESTFKKSYIVCGNSSEKNIRVELLIANTKGEYEPFANIDKETGWDIGESGLFMKEVVLPKTGANKIRVVAFEKSKVKANDLVLGKNLQLNNFTISVLEESVKDKIKNGFFNVTDILKGIFGGKN